MSDDFAIEWQPGERELTWRRNAMHHPHPVEPLFGDYHRVVLDEAFNRSAEVIGIRARNRSRVFNGYYYSTNFDVPGTSESFASSRVLSLTLDLHAEWTGRWLPEVKGLLSSQEEFPLGACSRQELSEHFVRTLRFSRRAWEIHYELVWPMTLAISLYADAYHELFPESAGFAPYALLQGSDNESTLTDRAIWALSRRFVHESRALAALIDLPITTREQLVEVASAELVASFDELLRRHGRRSDAFDHLTSPSWIEEPRPVFDLLRRFVVLDVHPLAEALSRAAATRDAELARVSRELESYPSAARHHFDALHRSALTATALYEDHNHWIDQRVDHEVRRVVVEAGRRLCLEGVLASEDDVFGLTLEELSSALGTGGDSSLARVASERRHRNRMYERVVPPVAIGAVPTGGAPESTDDPIERALRLFVGIRPTEPTDPRMLRGIGGAPGEGLGRVRVVRVLEDIDRLLPGEILVAPTTAPSWSPVFNLVTAVVTDAGGMLSHCAIIAREYGVPCVVGCVDATSRLKDGDLVRVNGQLGTVTLEGAVDDP